MDIPERTVRKLKFAGALLAFEGVVERDHNALGLLVYKHGVTLREGAATNILTGYAPRLVTHSNKLSLHYLIPKTLKQVDGSAFRVHAGYNMPCR